MNIEELRKKSIEQFAMLRKNALHEAYLNAPIRSAAGASSSGGSAEPEPVYNFDVTATDWTNWDIVDEASFITFLASRGGGGKSTNSFAGIIVTDFTFVDGRIRCNLTATSTNGTFYLNALGITNVLGLGNTAYRQLDLSYNSISEFDIELPDECGFLNLNSNQIEVFNPSSQLPSSLLTLFLNDNLITEFDPDLPLPSGLLNLWLSGNQLTFFNPLQWSNTIRNLKLDDNLLTFAGYTASEPWANRLEQAPLNALIEVRNNPDGISGTGLYDILLSKGWSFVV